MIDILEGVDFNEVRKGTVFSTSMLVRQFGVLRDDREFPKMIMKFAAAVPAALDRLGRPATVRTQDDCVKVLTDDESIDYNNGHFHGYLHREAVRNHRMKLIDKDNLSFPRRQEYDRAILHQGVILVAIRAARREIARADHVRAHPEGPFGNPGEGD